MKHVFRNWKTSLLGICAALPQIITAYSKGDTTGLITGIATLLLGLLAKDANKSHTQYQDNK